MYFKKNIKFKNNKLFLVTILFFISIISRVPVVLIYSDAYIQNEWGPLVNNLINNNTLSLIEFDGFLLPNLLMPPLYAYYLFIFSFLDLELKNFLLVVFFSQTFLSAIAVIIFYKINKFFFNDKVSFYSSILFSLFPIYLYSCSQISSASLTIFLALLFYYFFFKIRFKRKLKYIILLSLVSGMLILLRREFIGIVILSNFYLFFLCKLKVKDFIIIFLITLITISPYLIRNYIIFDKMIISSGLGYNLWKANNPKSKVEGFQNYAINKKLKSKINEIPKDKFYRINENLIFLNEAIKNIKSDYERYILLYIKRFFYYFFIDLESTYPNYFNKLHYIPVLIISITSFFGILIYNKKSLNMNYLLLILFFYITTFAFFAILPRYKIYILPFQIIFTNILISYLIDKFYKKRASTSYYFQHKDF